MNQKKTWPLFSVISLIAVLFAGMLVLCGLYIDLRVNGVSSSLPPIPENDKWILTDSGYNAHNSAQRSVSFSFIGFKTPDTGMTAAAFSRSSRNALADIFEKYALPLLTGEVSRPQFESEKEKNEYLASLLSQEAFMYVSFYNELPSAVLAPGLYGVSGVKESFGVRYMFVVPDGESVVGVCLDSKLNPVVLTTERELFFDRTEFLTYNGVSGFAGFEFLSDTNPEPVFTESFEVESVMIVPSFSFYNFAGEDTNTKQLLKVLGFNTSLVKKYSSGNNREISFVNDGSELYISLDGEVVSYNGYDGGIHMSEFLKYYPQSDEYSFTDAVLCVKYLVSSIDRLLVGGEAVPTIVGVSTENGEIVFKMKYFYNGILLTDNPSDITVTLDAEYIKQIEIHAVFCDSGRLTKPSFPQKTALSAVDTETLAESVGFNAMFRKNDETGIYELVWTVRKAGE